jgi:hypothetical protein
VLTEPMPNGAEILGERRREYLKIKKKRAGNKH